MKMTTANIIITLLGGISSGAYAYNLYLRLASAAENDYPPEPIGIPSGAQYSDFFKRWAKENGYAAKKGTYVKGSGRFTSATEISFDGNNMYIAELVGFFGHEKRFAINAPVSLSKLPRKAKIKQINRLLEHWQCPQLETLPTV